MSVDRFAPEQLEARIRAALAVHADAGPCEDLVCTGISPCKCDMDDADLLDSMVEDVMEAINRE
jgi:hypothetical protein